MNLLDKHLKEVVNVSWNFAGRCGDLEDEITNAGIGVGAEGGEVTDVIKKWRFHSIKQDHHNFYRSKIILELGDVLYYVLKLMDLFGITLEEVLAANKAKLESRHPEHGKVTERFGEGYVK